MTIGGHLRYARYVLRHKWFVWREGRKLGLGVWQLLIHDWSKFLPSEWLPYARYFYGKPGEAGRQEFDLAWLLHQKRNPHHWQFWVLLEDNPEKEWTVQANQPEFGPYWLAYRNEPLARFETPSGEDTSDAAYRLVGIAEAALARGEPAVLPMPDRYRREMLADWRGAGLAQGNPNTERWYLAKRKLLRLHPETRRWIEQQLEVTDGADQLGQGERHEPRLCARA